MRSDSERQQELRSIARLTLNLVIARCTIENENIQVENDDTLISKSSLRAAKPRRAASLSLSLLLSLTWVHEFFHYRRLRIRIENTNTNTNIKKGKKSRSDQEKTDSGGGGGGVMDSCQLFGEENILTCRVCKENSPATEHPGQVYWPVGWSRACSPAYTQHSFSFYHIPAC